MSATSTVTVFFSALVDTPLAMIRSTTSCGAKRANESWSCFEARRGALQATAQVLHLRPGAPEGVAERGDDRADPGGEKRARWHRDGGHRSSATAESRQTALASAAMPTNSR